VRVFDDDDPARGIAVSAADRVRIGEDGSPGDIWEREADV
jgi:hypothetical protein